MLEFEVKHVLFKKDKNAFSASVHWSILQSDSVGGAVDVLSAAEHFRIETS